MIATEKWRYPKPVKVKRPGWVTRPAKGGQAAVDRAFNMLMATARPM